MKNFRPDIAALEEKIVELEEQVEDSKHFLDTWAKQKDDAYETAKAQLRVVTLKWNSLKTDRTAKLVHDCEHIQLLRDSIERLKVEV